MGGEGPPLDESRTDEALDSDPGVDPPVDSDVELSWRFEECLRKLAAPILQLS